MGDKGWIALRSCAFEKRERIITAEMARCVYANFHSKGHATGRYPTKASRPSQPVLHATTINMGPPNIDAATARRRRCPDRVYFFPSGFRSLVNGPSCRKVQSSFASSDDDDEVAAWNFLTGLGYADDVAEGIMSALKEPGSGVGRGDLESTLRALAGRPEVGVDAGLKAIAQAVEVELEAKKGKQIIHLHVRVPHANREFDVEGLEGMSLRDIATNTKFRGAEELGEYLECACSGHMACSTCHVYVDPQWYDKFGGEPDPAETVRLSDPLHGSFALSTVVRMRNPHAD
jgi:ferredoxin